MVDREFGDLLKEQSLMLPHIVHSCPRNIEQFVVLVRVLQNCDSSAISRGKIYIPIIISLFAAQFVQISLLVLVQQKSLDSFTPLYLIKSLVNFLIVLAQLLISLTLGSKANALDEQLHLRLVKLKEAAETLKVLKDDNCLFKMRADSSQFEVLEKLRSEEGGSVAYQSLVSEESFSQEAVEREMEEIGEDMKAKIEALRDGLEVGIGKFETYQEESSLKLFHLKINWDLVFSLLAYLGTIAVAYIQSQQV